MVKYFGFVRYYMSFINWFKSLFRSIPVTPDVYKPAEMLIYRYWNGKADVAADPLTLYKKMMAKGPELNIDMKIATSAHSDAGKAHDSMLVKIREIFDVKPFEEGGLTQLATIELLDDFLIFCDRVKKNGSPTVIKQEETSAGTVPSFAAPRPTLNSLDSGLTGKEPSIDKPPLQPTEPVLPLA